jgi:hypothetical protein
MMWSPTLLSERIASASERAAEAALLRKSEPLRLFPARRSDERVNLDGNLIVVGGTEGWYEYVFQPPEKISLAYFVFDYSSGDSRPAMLNLNGADVGACCEVSTGGFGAEDVQRVRVGPHQLCSGENILRVSTAAGCYFPHIAGLHITDAEHSQLTQDTSKLWLVPPSRPLQPDSICWQITDICSVGNLQPPQPDFVPDTDFYDAVNLDGLWVLASKQCRSGTVERAASLMAMYVPVELRRLCLQWRAPLDR